MSSSIKIENLQSEVMKYLTDYVEAVVKAIADYGGYTYTPPGMSNGDTYIVEKGDMYRLKEIEPLLSSDSFFEDPVKRCMAMFLAEVMSRSLRDADPDENLFDFVVSAINALSTRPLSPDFHLYFLLRLSAYLGFEPNMDGQGEAFDLENGVRCHPDPANMHVLDEQYSLLLIRLCQMDGTLTLTHAERQHLLDIILLYYKLHLPAFGNVRSLDVLRELFA